MGKLNQNTLKLKNPTSSMGDKNIPFGIRLWAILNYISGFFMIVSGILLFFHKQVLNFLLIDSSIIPPFGSVKTIGIIFLILGIIDIFAAKGLFRGKNWSRIISIIFMVLGIFGAIYLIFAKEMISNLFSLIIYGLIIYYLTFNQKVKEFFS